MHDLVLEMAQSKSFWARAAQSPQNPGRTKRPVDEGYFFFFTPTLPWSAKQLYGLLANIKQKQFNY